MKRRLLGGVLALVAVSACSGRRAPTSPDRPPSRVEEGFASWYGLEEAGRATASGEPMAPEKLTAAHKSLAFGSLVRVTDLDTGKRVDVIINDRGPFVRGRIIDLSFAAARDLGVVEKGVTRVRIEVIGLAGPLAERRWRVQAGSFEAEARAQELLTSLQTQGHGPVLLTEFENEGALYHRVWVGSFRERDAAERLLRQLQLQGFSGFVILAAATSP